MKIKCQVKTGPYYCYVIFKFYVLIRCYLEIVLDLQNLSYCDSYVLIQSFLSPYQLYLSHSAALDLCPNYNLSSLHPLHHLCGNLCFWSQKFLSIVGIRKSPGQGHYVANSGDSTHIKSSVNGFPQSCTKHLALLSLLVSLLVGVCGMGLPVTIGTATTGAGDPGFPRWNSNFLLNSICRIHCIMWPGDIMG